MAPEGIVLGGSQQQVAFGHYVLVPQSTVRAWGAEQRSGFEPVPVREAQRLVRSAFDSPSARAPLYALYLRAAPWARIRPPSAGDLAVALAWLTRSLEQREGAVVFRRMLPTAAKLEPELPIEPYIFKPSRNHYVDLLFVDQRGAPLGAGAFKITLPDGVEQEGTVGPLGAAYFTCTAGGSARWTAPASELDDEKGAVIELQLKTPRGGPASNIAFELKGSDGTVVRGVTDEQGRAIAGGLPDGAAELSFPDLDESAWQRGTPSGGEP
jgi:hypothetical protein